MNAAVERILIGRPTPTWQERRHQRLVHEEVGLIEGRTLIRMALVRAEGLATREGMLEMANNAALQEALTKRSPLADEGINDLRQDSDLRIRRLLED